MTVIAGKKIWVTLSCLILTMSTHSIPGKSQEIMLENASLNSNGELKVTPSATSNARDFDFLIGCHKVHHKMLKRRLTNSNEWIEFEGIHDMNTILKGVGDVENHYMNFPDGKYIEGMALRLFNPTTRLWSIYWAESEHGILDIPVVGSFDGDTGYFFAKDQFEGKEILIKFKWDITERNKPIWAQAFSSDSGRTWEWNWYMYFSKSETNDSLSIPTTSDSENIGVIELRNYQLKPGMREKFTHYFESNFIESQEKLKGHPLGQYRVKGSEDNFFWIRGFENMDTRSSFLPAFYTSDYWRQRAKTANEMMINTDNVYLLRPLSLKKDSLVPGSIKKSKLNPHERIAVVDFYTANTQLAKLQQILSKTYLPLLHECGIHDYTIWISELTENDFPALPVFQDKDLLVTITFYKDELEYMEKTRLTESKMSEEFKMEMRGIVTFKRTLILYPTSYTKNQ